MQYDNLYYIATFIPRINEGASMFRSGVRYAHRCFQSAIAVGVALAMNVPPIQAQQKSLRQEREEVRSLGIQTAQKWAYCVGYFEQNTEAAEVLELKAGVNQEDARVFLRKVMQFNFNFDQMLLPFMIGAGGDQNYIDALGDARQRGFEQGQIAASHPGQNAVFQTYKDCSLLLKLALPEEFEPPVAFRLTLSTTSLVQLSATEVFEIQKTIAPCFHVPLDAAMGVTIEVDIIPSLKVGDITPVDRDRMKSDTNFAHFVNAIRRSLENRRCQPWPVKFVSNDNLHMRIRLNFDARVAPTSDPKILAPQIELKAQQPSRSRGNVNDDLIDSILKNDGRRFRTP